METITTIIGLLAATGTTASFIPQVLKIYRTKKTTDLSLKMYAILTTGVFLWLVYGIIERDLPIILANAITFIFSSSILALKIKHG
ncbi:SemiSWEET transporter [Candidatus Woesearchaeota archaeon]|nr:SemiSWEET transporter [Candidatus Woesearchaeota archaeon]